MRALAIVAFVAAAACPTLETALPAAASERTTDLRNLPADVRDFIGRRANCKYWLSEETSYAERTELGEDDYDSEREAQIRAALNRLRCHDLAKDEIALQRRYATNATVLSALGSSKNVSPN